MQLTISLEETIVDFLKEKTKEEDMKAKIEKIVETVLTEEGLSFLEVSLSISAADTKEIQAINKEYRGIDKATDVLSFPIFEKEELKQMALQTDIAKQISHVELGDIILCLSVVEEHATEYGTGILRETLYMITHGVCHLVGHDHMEEEEKKRMRALEEKVLCQIGVKQEDE